MKHPLAEKGIEIGEGVWLFPSGNGSVYIDCMGDPNHGFHSRIVASIWISKDVRLKLAEELIKCWKDGSSSSSGLDSPC